MAYNKEVLKRRKKWLKEITTAFREIRWLRVLKMISGSLAGIALVGLAALIAPSNFPGTSSLKQLAATTLVNLTVLPPTPTVNSATPNQTTQGATATFAIAGTNFGWNYGSNIDPWFAPFVSNVVLFLGTEQIICTNLNVTSATLLNAVCAIPQMASGGQWWSLKVTSDVANNVSGILSNAVYVSGATEVSRVIALATAAASSGGGGTRGPDTLPSPQKPSDVNAITIGDNTQQNVITKVLTSEKLAANEEKIESRTIVEVTIPKNVVPPNTKVKIESVILTAQITPMQSAGLPQILPVGDIVDITMSNNEQQLSQMNSGGKIIVNIEIPASVAAAPNEYGLFYLKEIAQKPVEWIRVLNAKIGKTFITAELDHLTKFAVFKVAQSVAMIPIATKKTIGATTTFTFERHLTLGSKGNDVTRLQEILTSEKVYSGPITGYFGILTQAGVKNYQKKYSIVPQSGYVGPKTIAVLNALPANTTVVTPEPKSNPAMTNPTAPTQNITVTSMLQKIMLLLQDLLKQLK